jgi:hypothetical protein
VSEERFDFLVGEVVNQIWFWGVIRLVFDRPSAKAWYVDVWRFRLVAVDGASALIDASGPPLETAPTLQLLKQSVTSASAAEGVLTLRFANGVTLEALPDDTYESWAVAGPNGFVQCLPGGETASW